MIKVAATIIVALACAIPANLWAGLPTEDQRGYYKGKVTTTFYHLDSAGVQKVKGEAIFDIGAENGYLAVQTPNVFISTEGSPDYGIGTGTFLGANGTRAVMQFKGSGKKVTVTLNGTAIKPVAGQTFSIQISGKLKRMPME